MKIVYQSNELQFTTFINFRLGERISSETCTVSDSVLVPLVHSPSRISFKNILRFLHLGLYFYPAKVTKAKVDYAHSIYFVPFISYRIHIL